MGNVGSQILNSDPVSSCRPWSPKISVTCPRSSRESDSSNSWKSGTKSCRRRRTRGEHGRLEEAGGECRPKQGYSRTGDSHLSRAFAWLPEGPIPAATVSMVHKDFTNTIWALKVVGVCIGWCRRVDISVPFLHSLCVRQGLAQNWDFGSFWQGWQPASSVCPVSTCQGCRWRVAVYPTCYMDAGIRASGSQGCSGNNP